MKRAPPRLPLPVLCLAVLLSLLPGGLAAQEPDEPEPAVRERPAVVDTGGPVSPDSADRLRAAMRRPPGNQPLDALGVAGAPFQLVFVPLLLLGEVMGSVLDLLAPSGPDAFYVRAVRDMIEAGVRPGVGTAGPRSGLAPKFEITTFEPFFLKTRYSIRGSQSHETGFRHRGKTSEARLFFAFRRHNQPRFFGFGSQTTRETRTDFQLDRVEWVADGRLAPTGWLGLRGEFGYEENRVEAGGDDDSPPLHEVFPPETIFGVDERTRFFRLGLETTLDFTRIREFQERGLRLDLGSTLYRGAGPTDADFHRLEGVATAFLPLNARQQLVLIGGTEVNREDSGPGVPFTHMATLGGGGLGGRGYSTGRFRDQDKLFGTAEWRYEIWRELQTTSRVEGFVFFEEGAVDRRLGDISSSDWRPSWGVGLRVVDRTGLRVLTYLADSEEDLNFTLDLSKAFR